MVEARTKVVALLVLFLERGMRPRRVDFTSRVSLAVLAKLVEWLVLPSKEIPAREFVGALPGKGLGRFSKKGLAVGVYPALSFWPRSSMTPKRHRRTRPSHRGL
jgi:hypothetical protein